MRLLTHLHDPEPTDVGVTPYDYEGEPRVRISLGQFSIHGTRDGLAAVMSEIMRGLAGLPLPLREPEPLVGDYTFLTGSEPRVGMLVPPSTLPGDVVEIGRIGSPALRIKVDSVGTHPGGGQAVAGTIVGVVEPDDDGSEVYEPGKGWRRPEPGEVVRDDRTDAEVRLTGGHPNLHEHGCDGDHHPDAVCNPEEGELGAADVDKYPDAVTETPPFAGEGGTTDGS